MALHLITGYAGKAHITAADQGAFNAGIFGTKDYVVNAGNKFAAVPITANTIKILDGEIILHGRHIRIEAGAYEEVTVENGTADHKRNDLICIRYTKDSEAGIENASCVVIKGTPDASKAVDPAYNTGSILEGTLTVDFPLYRVPLDGLNVGTLVQLFEVQDSLADRATKLETSKVDKVAGKGLSANDYSNTEKQQVATNKANITKLTNGTTPAGNSKLLNGLTAKQVGESGARNLIPYPYYSTSKTSNGITWVVNDDGSVTIDGTCTAVTWVLFRHYSVEFCETLKKFSKLTMSDGLSSTRPAWVFLSGYDENQTRLHSNDLRNGASMEIIPDESWHSVSMGIYIPVNAVLDNLTFKPMLELGSVAHDFVPYHLGGAEHALDADTLNGLIAEEFVNNENLLVNPYFLDPVNSSGKTEWSGTGTTIDMWSGIAATVTTTLTENGLRVVNTSTASNQITFKQNGTLSLKTGKYSISAKVVEMHGTWYIGGVIIGGNYNLKVGENAFKFERTTDTDSATFYFWTTNGDGTNYIVLEWVKLAPGSVATPFIPPNKEIEKLKCGATVGDADTVDGLHASNFLQKIVLKSGADANTLVDERTYFVMNGANTPFPHGFIEVKYYNGGNFDPSGGVNGVTKCVRQVFYPYGSGVSKTRYGVYKTNLDTWKWGEWTTDFLPLDGSVPMSGNVTINRNGLAYVTAINTAQGTEIMMECSDSGRIGIWDEVNKMWLLMKDTDGVLKCTNESNTATYNFLHTGNSAAVVVSETPLTAEGSVRVW